MLFSSIPFLYYFLPAFFICYSILPKRWKNNVLFFGSLFFYAYGCPENLLLILSAILTGYLGGILVGIGAMKKYCLPASVTILLAFLGYFKYAGFFLENLNRLLPVTLPGVHTVLPIGISFYTFQIISYLVDVYREEVPYQTNFIDFGAYVVFFPQLIAGPIVRYKEIADSLKSRTHTTEHMYNGITRFLIGLGKKILLANSLAQLCDHFRASDEKSVLFYWIYAAAFMLFIYFDFSGYSDMAIGLGDMMGFRLPENFDYPYLSRSITEFWRRWHITLGRWFRDYVYIPLGGSRVRPSRWYLHIFLVWTLTGLWHGASWNFVIWGLFSAVFLILEKQTGFPQKLPKAAAHIYALMILMISFVIFNAADLAHAKSDLLALFGCSDLPLITTETLYYFKSYLFTFIIAAIGCTPLPKSLSGTIAQRYPSVFSVLKSFGLIALLFLCTAYLVDGSFNPFLYFRF